MVIACTFRKEAGVDSMDNCEIMLGRLRVEVIESGRHLEMRE